MTFETDIWSHQLAQPACLWSMNDDHRYTPPLASWQLASAFFLQLELMIQYHCQTLQVQAICIKECSHLLANLPQMDSNGPQNLTFTI